MPLEYMFAGTVFALLLIIIALLFGLYSLAARPGKILAEAQEVQFIFPFVETERARAAAARRRDFVISRLSGGAGESLETPQRVDGESLSTGLRDLDESEGAGQLATLRWQLNDDAFLLLGRTIDLITLICRSEEDEEKIRSTVRQIKLRKATRREIRSNSHLYPFYIVLELEDSEFWIERLRPYQDWLSIGLSIQRRIVEIEAFGRCQVGGGREGKCGGYLSAGGAKYQITCSHVLSSDCASCHYCSPLPSETRRPDIAVLLRANPCFESSFNGIKVRSITHDSAYLFKEQTFIRVPGRHRSGIFHEVVGWATYEGRTHKFPHGQLTADISIVLDFFSWPPWARNFSSEGDSGSWVVKDNSNDWLGVLVAGNRTTHVSYVALSGPVMDFVKAEVNIDPHAEPYREN